MVLQTLLFSLGLLLVTSRSVSSELMPYVVFMGAQSQSHTYESDLAGAELPKVTHSHHEILASTVGSMDLAGEAIIHSYQRLINGFSAILSENDAAKIAEHPGVVSVFPDGVRQLDTTHSWEFMALENNGVVNPSSLWTQASYGEDVIIATLDSGVWPESKSFSDEGFGPIPSRWHGECENNTKEGVPCNKKLIGASYINKGYLGGLKFVGKEGLISLNNSTRDTDGHGTHTLATAGGNFVPNATIFGLNIGTVKGGAPRARVATYKVCWPAYFLEGNANCVESDTMQGYVQAVLDGVDVISMSIGKGGSREYLKDSVAIGSFTAMMAGIVVVCSAGNEGPTAETVDNVAPWVITVAASTIDRDFESFVELGSGLKFKGIGLSPSLPENKQYPLISGANARQSNASSFDALQCLPNTIDPAKVKGNILVCLRGGTNRFEKAREALFAGALGMIVCNDHSHGDELTPLSYMLPVTHINYADGQAVFNYVNNTRNPIGYITPTVATTDVKPSPIMAEFSSRGPNAITPQILKPDITAPGVNIIAAYTETPPEKDSGNDEPKTPFIMLNGTSMACPHVAAIAALLKKVHPDWSPAAIKSAIMTTARTKDNTGNVIRDHEMKQATPFSYGAGHINPNRAMDPGLIYDLTVNDYLNFLCASAYNETTLERFYGTSYLCPKSFSLMDFNYPSFSVPNISSTVTATRKVKNVGSPGTYVAKVVQPAGVLITVEPSELKFDKVGEEKSFKVIFAAKEQNLGLNYVFGKLTWSDGRHCVKSPIVASVLST